MYHSNTYCNLPTSPSPPPTPPRQILQSLWNGSAWRMYVSRPADILFILWGIVVTTGKRRKPKQFLKGVSKLMVSVFKRCKFCHLCVKNGAYTCPPRLVVRYRAAKRHVTIAMRALSSLHQIVISCCITRPAISMCKVHGHWHGATQHSHCARMSIRKVAARVMLSPLVLLFIAQFPWMWAPYPLCFLGKPHFWSDGCSGTFVLFLFGPPTTWLTLKLHGPPVPPRK